MPGLKLTQLDAGIPKVGYDLPLYHLRVRGKGRLLNRIANDLQPKLHKVGKEHIGGQFSIFLADGGRHIGLTQLQKHLFRALFVVLNWQSRWKPRLLPFAVGVQIAQDHIIVVVFDLQVSRYHSSIPPFADSV